MKTLFSPLFKYWDFWSCSIYLNFRVSSSCSIIRYSFINVSNCFSIVKFWVFWSCSIYSIKFLSLLQAGWYIMIWWFSYPLIVIAKYYIVYAHEVRVTMEIIRNVNNYFKIYINPHESLKVLVKILVKCGMVLNW